MIKNDKEVSRVINISVTKNSKTPCLWERGGYDEKKRKGYAIIIANKDGQKKSSIALRDEINNRHAMVPIEIGDLCIEAIKDDRNKVFDGKVCINVWKVITISINTEKEFPSGNTTVNLLNNFSFEIWSDKEGADLIKVCVDKAIEKCQMVNCKNVLFASPVTLKRKY